MDVQKVYPGAKRQDKHITSFVLKITTSLRFRNPTILGSEMFHLVLVGTPSFQSSQVTALQHLLATSFPDTTIHTPITPQQVQQNISLLTPVSTIFIILNNNTTTTPNLLTMANTLQKATSKYLVFHRPLKGFQSKTVGSHEELLKRIREVLEPQSVRILVATSNNPLFLKDIQKLKIQLVANSPVRVDQELDLEKVEVSNIRQDIILVLNDEDIYKHNEWPTKLSQKTHGGKVVVVVYSRKAIIPYGFQFDQLVTNYSELSDKITWLVKEFISNSKARNLKVDALASKDRSSLSSETSRASQLSKAKSERKRWVFTKRRSGQSATPTKEYHPQTATRSTIRSREHALMSQRESIKSQPRSILSSRGSRSSKETESGFPSLVAFEDAVIEESNTQGLEDRGRKSRDTSKKRHSTIGYNDINLDELMKRMAGTDLLPNENNSAQGMSSASSFTSYSVTKPLSNNLPSSENNSNYFPKSNLKNGTKLLNVQKYANPEYNPPNHHWEHQPLPASFPPNTKKRGRVSILNTLLLPDDDQILERQIIQHPYSDNIQLIFKTGNPYVCKLSLLFDDISFGYRKYENLQQLRTITKSFNHEILTVAVIDQEELTETLKELSVFSMLFYLISAPSESLWELESVLPKDTRLLAQEEPIDSTFRDVSAYIRLLRINQYKHTDVDMKQPSSRLLVPTLFSDKPTIFYPRSEAHSKTLVQRACPHKFNLVDYKNVEELEQMLRSYHGRSRPTVIFNQYYANEAKKHTDLNTLPRIRAILFEVGKILNNSAYPGMLLISSDQRMTEEAQRILQKTSPK